MDACWWILGNCTPIRAGNRSWIHCMRHILLILLSWPVDDGQQHVSPRCSHRVSVGDHRSRRTRCIFLDWVSPSDLITDYARKNMSSSAPQHDIRHVVSVRALKIDKNHFGPTILGQLREECNGIHRQACPYDQ